MRNRNLESVISDETLLARFPKSRPELPEVFRAIYVQHYQMNRGGSSPATSMAQRMEAWMHRKAAQDVVERPANYTTLEVGAGNLNHLKYEPSSGHYDIVEPFTELYANSPEVGRITHAHQSISDVNDERFDRIIAIAAFEHLCDLPFVVAKCGALLEPRGQLRVAIPSEGTILWGLGWRLTTGVEFWLRRRLDYGVLMRHEHVNTAAEIAQVLNLFFEDIRRTVFGISPRLSFYQFFVCAKPNVLRCRRYLQELNAQGTGAVL